MTKLKYDASADVLYISTNADIAAVHAVSSGNVIWRYDEDGDVVGVTVMDFYEDLLKRQPSSPKPRTEATNPFPETR
jgi:uncharacterized protein YuzE